MSYYTGEALLRRVKQYNLMDVHAALLEFSAGRMNTWPKCRINLSEEVIPEQVRNTIYSMLYETGTKPYFTVHLRPGVIIIMEKKKAVSVQFDNVLSTAKEITIKAAASPPATTSLDDDPDAGLLQIFDD